MYHFHLIISTYNKLEGASKNCLTLQVANCFTPHQQGFSTLMVPLNHTLWWVNTNTLGHHTVSHLSTPQLVSLNIQRNTMFLYDQRTLSWGPSFLFLTRITKCVNIMPTNRPCLLLETNHRNGGWPGQHAMGNVRFGTAYYNYYYTTHFFHIENETITSIILWRCTLNVKMDYKLHCKASYEDSSEHRLKKKQKKNLIST